MQKAGMHQEGVLVDQIMKNGKSYTLVVDGIVNSRQKVSKI
jgi:hypothetical protein